MLTRLIELGIKKTVATTSGAGDILIAETAIKNGLILLPSGDSRLRTVTTEFGGRAEQPPR